MCFRQGRLPSMRVHLTSRELGVICLRRDARVSPGTDLDESRRGPQHTPRFRMRPEVHCAPTRAAKAHSTARGRNTAKPTESQTCASWARARFGQSRRNVGAECGPAPSRSEPPALLRGRGRALEAL